MGQPHWDVTVARIIKAVGRLPRDPEQLSNQLAEVNWEYRLRRVSEYYPEAGRVYAELAALHDATRKFGRALFRYDDAGRLGWSRVEAAAKINFQRLGDKRLDVEAQLLAANEEEARELRDEKWQIDSSLFVHDHAPIETLNRIYQGIAALDIWLGITFETYEAALKRGQNIFSTDRGEVEPGQPSAKRWLICSALPQVYASAFDRRTKRPRQKQGVREVFDPKIEFTKVVLQALGVKNDRDSPFAADTIKTYWKEERKGQRQRSGGSSS